MLLLGSHQTRNLSDVFPSPAAGPLCPAVTSCQLSGGGAAAVRPQRSPHPPSPTSRPAKQPGSESESYSRLPTIGSRSFAVIVGNFHNSSTLLFLPPPEYPPLHPALELQTIHQQSCTITEKAPTRAFSWIKAATTTSTFKNLLRYYAKKTLTHGK